VPGQAPAALSVQIHGHLDANFRPPEDPHATCPNAEPSALADLSRLDPSTTTTGCSTPAGGHVFPAGRGELDVNQNLKPPPPRSRDSMLSTSTTAAGGGTQTSSEGCVLIKLGAKFQPLRHHAAKPVAFPIDSHHYSGFEAPSACSVTPRNPLRRSAGPETGASTAPRRGALGAHPWQGVRKR